MKIETKTSKPVVNEVIITLTFDEAKTLHKMVGISGGDCKGLNFKLYDELGKIVQ